MNKKDLLSAFHIEAKPNKLIADYEIFKDKDLLDDLRAKIIENIADKQINQTTDFDHFVTEEIESVIKDENLSNMQRNHLYHLIDNEVKGFGPITELLEDDNISSIMINSPKDIYIESEGKIIKDSSISFINNAHILRTIKKIFEKNELAIDFNKPIIETCLKNKTKINVISKPVALNGIAVVIKKNNTQIKTMDDYLRIGSLTPYMALFLQAIVKGKLNILICGKAGVGKTTLVNVLGSLMEDEERIITIENQRELNILKPHVISLTNNLDSSLKKSSLFLEALKFQAERIIYEGIDESDVLEVILANNMKDEGQIFTMNASSVNEAIENLEMIIMMQNPHLNLTLIKEKIYKTLDVIVYVEKLPDKKRRITKISEVTDNKINDIFAYNYSKNNTTGEYVLYKNKPLLIDKLVKKGINDINYMFKE